MKTVGLKAVIFILLCNLGAQGLTAATTIQTPTLVAKEFVTYAPRPEYPYVARALHKTGSAVFVFKVDDRTGRVTAIDVAQSTGYKLLDWACIKAFIQWRFKPHTVTKVKVPVTFTMTRG